ncbi:MAG: M14 family metallopeptidase [Bacteroidia bacterium]|nr:M14 family metallopeptidase [Bacteroidia bacterium]
MKLISPFSWFFSFFTFFTFFTFLPSGAQIRPLNVAAWPESDKDTTHYTVKGYRHGTSVFPQVKYKEVEYTAGDTLTWDRYHTVDVIYAWMKRWAEKYPNLVDLYEVGFSYEGRPILQVTLTNKKTGKDTDKPAAFFEGGRHSGEVTATESALWLLNHLLNQYGTDPAITKLLDTKAIYIRPENNPDGSNLYLNTAQSNRSTVHPADNDGDGLLDEDPGEDLDGDGVLYTMRWVDLEKGTLIPDPRDPSGRLMKRVPKGKGLWSASSEGWDNDGDGKINEDGIGGLDLHRNYPENWRPEEGLDATGRGWTQGGAGEYPLSESETRAVFNFLITHPNVSVVNSMDTRVPMHLRGPSTEFSAKGMYEADRKLFEYYDTLGMNITGYPWAGDVYDEYSTKDPVDDYTGDSAKPEPLFGHGPDFGYSYFGAIWYGDELWNGGVYGDLNKDGKKDELDILLWDDQENGGRGFKKWSHFINPFLGPVELGGFNPKFFSQNPPPEHLEPWIRKQGLFNLAMAHDLPVLEWNMFAVKKLKDYKDSTDYQVTVGWRNTSRIPTALNIAQRVKIVQLDQAVLDFDKKLIEGDQPKIRIVDPKTSDKTRYSDHLWQNQEASAAFTIRTYSRDKIKGKVKVLSTRGGVLEKEIILE